MLSSQGHLGLVQFPKFDYTSYHFGKQTKLPYNNSDSFSSIPFNLIHSDIWGLALVPTEGGSRYFVIFVDDFSWYTWIYLLYHMFELMSIYQTIHKMIETQFNHAIKIFRSNNAHEYNEKSFLSFLDSNGTLPHQFCPYTSQKLVVPNENIITFLMLSAPFSFLPLFLSTFGVRHPWLLLSSSFWLCLYCLSSSSWTDKAPASCSSLLLPWLRCIQKGFSLLWFHNSSHLCVPSCCVLGTSSFHKSSVVSYALFLKVSHFYWFFPPSLSWTCGGFFNIGCLSKQLISSYVPSTWPIYLGSYGTTVS